MRMGWIVLTAAFLASTLSPGSPDPDEVGGDHEVHPGLIHAGEQDESHRHGDSDDHHESPDSPCHHHETHYCCGTGMALIATHDFSTGETMISHRFAVPEVAAHAALWIRAPFHIPLA